MRLIQIFSLLALMTSLGSSAYAKSYALLVGISDYQGIPALEGPQHDVEAMYRLLLKQWSFKKSDITRLVNQQASKANIIEALNQLVNKVQPGDQALIYFSGHGTSRHDPQLKPPLPTDSGAFIPFDVQKGDIHTVLNSLIIGRRDLVPILSLLDQKKASVFFVIDACFSGKLVRGSYAKNKLPNRHIRFEDLIIKQSAHSSPSILPEPPVNTYQTIYSLSASSEYEPAQDIPSRYLSHYPTVDGNPHGAFTDTLLSVLQVPGAADANQDGFLSYLELKQSIVERMHNRGFSHTPFALPNLERDVAGLSFNRVLGKQVLPASIQAHHDQPFTVALSNQSNQPFKTLEQSLRGLSRTEVISNNATINLQFDKDEVIIASHHGDLLNKLHQPNPQDILAAVERHKLIHELIRSPFQSTMELEFEFMRMGNNGNRSVGDRVSFSVRTTQPAYLLIANLNAQGQVTILYPHYPEELAKLEAGTPISLANLANVVPPAGKDHVIAYSFAQWQPKLKYFMGKSFPLLSQNGIEFEQFVTQAHGAKARRNLELNVFLKNTLISGT